MNLEGALSNGGVSAFPGAPFSTTNPRIRWN